MNNLELQNEKGVGKGLGGRGDRTRAAGCKRDKATRRVDAEKPANKKKNNGKREENQTNAAKCRTVGAKEPKSAYMANGVLPIVGCPPAGGEKR